ncbi:dUTP diphosphatase [Veillonella intestinalis]|uniref:dUTP diphosphatase n=1 Tax=Veillonella intestinalis TaxID=2941341 RepID=UPI00203D4A7E|nr:hypothetical protein [Veillonella intestinalis]
MARTATTASKTKEVAVVSEPTLGVFMLDPNGQPPEYKTDKASCLDVYLIDDLRIAGKHECTSQFVPFGFKLDIPEGYSVRVHLRSSVAMNYPIQLANEEGIIDEDFTDEVKAIVRNLTNKAHYFRKGERLFQIEVVKDTRMKTKVLGEYTKETDRGETNGSTGK